MLQCRGDYAKKTAPFFRTLPVFLFHYIFNIVRVCIGVLSRLVGYGYAEIAVCIVDGEFCVSNSFARFVPNNVVVTESVCDLNFVSRGAVDVDSPVFIPQLINERTL